MTVSTNRITTVTKFFITAILCVVFLFTTIVPAQAATLDDLATAVGKLQVLVNKLKSAQQGSVLAATISTVSTAAELDAAIASATGGETILLNAGNYGSVSIRNKAYASTVTIKSANSGAMASIAELAISNSAKITLENLKLDYVFTAGDPEFATPFSIENKSSDITLTGLLVDGDMVSGRNAIDNGYANARGLQIADSNRITLQDSEVTKFLRGLIVYTSTEVKILDNNINLIRSDGINIVESQKVTIEDNNIHDFRCAPNSEDHADMIQFFTTGTSKPTTDVIIRNNTLNVGQGSWTQSLFMRNEVVDQGQAGAAMFYKNFLIEGNNISNAHTHGITMGEVDGLVVKNNKINAATLNTGDQHNVNYQQQFGAQSGIMVPKLSVSEVSKNVVLSGNTFTGGSFYTGTRVDPVTPPASWSVSTSPAPTPTPTSPSLTLSSSVSSVTSGGSATLTWSSTNATTCTASGDWTGSKSTSGSQSTGALSSTKTYTLACTGTGGLVTKSTSIGVSSVPLPTPTPTPTPVPTPVPPVTSAFKIGDRIEVKNNVNVRTSGSVTPATLMGINPQGSKGTLLNGPTESTESFGKVTWFNVNFDTGFDGWVGADNYTKITTPTPTPTPTPGTDSDGDGIADTIDNCASKVNTSQANFDNDAKGDACDSDDDNDGIRDTREILGCAFNQSTTCSSGTPIPTPTPAPTGTKVSITDNVNVRDAANGTKLGIQFKGAQGTQSTTLPIAAGGYTWVKVDFTSGVDGYVVTDFVTTRAVSGTDVQSQINSLLQQLAALQALLAQLLKAGG